MRFVLGRTDCEFSTCPTSTPSASPRRDGPTAGTHDFPVLEFLARLLAHVPDAHEVLVGHYRACSVRRRARWRCAGILSDARPPREISPVPGHHAPDWPALRARRQGWAELLQRPAASCRLRERIAAAPSRQARRYADSPAVHCNTKVGAEERSALIRPRREAALQLQRAVSQWDLSLRAHDETLAVARTIAVLDGASDIDVQHVAEALQYRVQQPIGK